MSRLPSLLLIAPLLLFAAAGPRADDAVPRSAAQVKLSFAPVVRKVAPAVVNIYTRRVVRTVSPLFDDPFFRHFFGDQMGLQRERVQRSLGSGVIVRPDGVVVTNYHVVKDSEAITVVLSDRREFDATLLGTDERTDLAVLKIDAGKQPLPVLPMGDSDALEVGDVVLAVGDPFGVGQTVTMGIVSALARTGIGVSDYRFFIQTDAAINPGNSGGALVDIDGNLVGINSSIYSQSGGSVGIGFAIPVNMVRVVLSGVVAGGKPVRPWLGASGQAVTAEMAGSLKLDRPVGVLVNDVRPGGPAAEAGLRIGDIITDVNGRAVDDPEALRYRIGTQPVAATVRIGLVRDGQASTVEVRLAPPPDSPPRDTTEIGGRNPLTGATVANLNPSVAEERGIAGAAKGVVVLGVHAGTIASRLEIAPDDLILKVNGRAIASVAELRTALAEPADKWQLTLDRNGKLLNMNIAD